MTAKPADAAELPHLSLCEVADLVRDGEASAVEVLEATFAHIDRTDPVHHAFTWQDREKAEARARALDAARRSGEVTGPLHGVPLAHKDMFYRSGRVSACGSPIRNATVQAKTAPVLSRLDAAGAVEVGGLAMVEFAMGPHGYNAHLPRALNPWGRDRVPCGSSSGSGVAVSARMVYGSLGSDTGGSVRCPAAANGIVGLLPTISLVPGEGMMPMSFTLDTAGPLTRTCRDAARMMTAVADPDPRTGAPIDYERDLDRPIDGLRIGVPRGYFDVGLDPSVAEVVAASLDVLRDQGARIVPVDMPESLDVVSRVHPLVMKAEGAANHRAWKRTRAADYSMEVGLRLEAGFFIPATDYINALQFREPALEDFVETVFSKVDVLHTALMPIRTPTLDDTSYENGPAYLEMVVALTRNTRPMNFLGLPALSVTCGRDPDGMPVSFQLIGRPFDEATLLKIGHRYQTETEWHLERPPELAA